MINNFIPSYAASETASEAGDGKKKAKKVGKLNSLASICGTLNQKNINASFIVNQSEVGSDGKYGCQA